MLVGAPVAVSPAIPTVAVGKSESFTAQEMFSDGTLHPLSATVTWTSGRASTDNGNFAPWRRSGEALRRRWNPVHRWHAWRGRT